MNLEEKVKHLLDNQPYPVIKKNTEMADKTSQILLNLGVQKESEFYKLYTQYFLHSLNHRPYTPDIKDPCDSFRVATFAHEVWGFPKNHILFTTGEGEGGYFYNIDDNTVWDCQLGQQDLLGTNQLKHWNGFYEFMVWYLTTEND